ncbi:MAG TPA: substrate-binding domain-containing protein [Xanthobacteraceae bacterium]|jgi:tungstate transport system substrate-binding protein|nr:substrate-binding domain-containing protein [Xanthobacteraceae bacterium]
MKFLAYLTAAACALAAGSASAQDRPAGDLLVLAATTSVEDSGLFDYLIPRFRAASGIDIHVVSRASSTALTTAEHGTIDVVIVNDPEALDRFVAAGDGARRHRFMSNQFIIVGPPSDPAGIRGSTDAPAALREIARKRATFVSRGDNSGTYSAEQHLWHAAGVNPKARSGSWYRETGLGMGLTVQMAGRLGAYALTDRATWAKSGDRVRTQVLVQGDPRLFNPYEVILVDAKRHPHVNLAAANAFIDWLISEAGRRAIADYKLNGEQAFTPAPPPTN